MNEKLNKNIPALRFLEFKDEWNELKFSKLIELISGQHLSPNEYSLESGEIPYFTGPSDFTNDVSGLTKWTKFSEKSAQKGDILITVKGNGVGEMLSLHLPCVAMGRQLMAIRPIKAVGEIIYQKLFTYKQQLQALASGNVIPGLARSDILNTKIYLPKIEEQEKIASFLRAIATRLTQLRRKRDRLQTYKRGVMQKIFSQQIRFRGAIGSPFPDWQKKALGELGKIISGLTYSPSDVTKEGLLVLRSSNVQDERIVFDDCVFVNVKVDLESLSQKDDILICVRNGSTNLIGKNALIPEDIPLSTHGAFMVVFRSYRNSFIFQLFKTDIYKKQVCQDLGARINSINSNRLRKYKFLIPSIEEQEKIADFLTAIDRKIEALSRQIEQTEQFKKGLLQKLFV